MLTLTSWCHVELNCWMPSWCPRKTRPSKSFWLTLVQLSLRQFLTVFHSVISTRPWLQGLLFWGKQVLIVTLGSPVSLDDNMVVYHQDLNSLMDPRSTTDFQFVQLFLVGRMAAKTLKLFTWYNWTWKFPFIVPMIHLGPWCFPVLPDMIGS